GSWFRGRLRWNSTGAQFDLFRDDYSSGGGLVTTTIATDTTLNALTPGQSYVLQVTWRGTTVNATLSTTDATGAPQTFVWRSADITNSQITYRNGRVGWVANFVDRDPFVDSFQVAAT